MTFSDLLSNITSIINDCILPFIIEFFSSGIGLFFVAVTTFMVVVYNLFRLMSNRSGRYR